MDEFVGAERHDLLTVGTAAAVILVAEVTLVWLKREIGLTRPDDPTLGARLATLNLRLSSIGEEIVELDRQIGAKDARITPEKAVRFAEVMRRKLHDAEDAQVRRAYVRGFVGEVVMTREKITIRGPNRALELAVAGDTPSDDAVRTFMGNWCARRDSNPRPRR